MLKSANPTTTPVQLLSELPHDDPWKKISLAKTCPKKEFLHFLLPFAAARDTKSSDHFYKGFLESSNLFPFHSYSLTMYILFSFTLGCSWILPLVLKFFLPLFFCFSKEEFVTLLLLLAIEEKRKLIIQQPKTSKKSCRIWKGTKLFHKSHNFSHTRRKKNHIFAKLANSNSLSLSSFPPTLLWKTCISSSYTLIICFQASQIWQIWVPHFVCNLPKP
jgi:hypothetical protein